MGKARKHWKDCPAPGCSNSIPKTNVFCFRHWFALPEDLRGGIEAALRKHDLLAKGKAVGDALNYFARKRVDGDEPARQGVKRMLGEPEE